jgi:hypothetical protein
MVSQWAMSYSIAEITCDPIDNPCMCYIGLSSASYVRSQLNKPHSIYISADDLLGHYSTEVRKFRNVVSTRKTEIKSSVGSRN